MKHRRNTWRWLVQKMEKGGGRKLSDLFLAGDNKSLVEATRISGEEAKSTSMEAMLGYVFLLRGGLRCCCPRCRWWSKRRTRLIVVVLLGRVKALTASALSFRGILLGARLAGCNPASMP